MKRDASEAAARKLSERNMSSGEMRNWLRNKGYEDEEISSVIREFTDLGYLDDERYALQFVAYGTEKRWGKQRILRELKARGVDSPVGENAYEDYHDTEEGAPDERDLALLEAEKVLRAADLVPGEEVPEKIRGRIARRLERNGFSGSLIVDVLAELRR